MRLFKLIIAFIFLTSISSGARARGGDIVGNGGGGLVENQFVYLWTHLDFFLKSCDVADACHLDRSSRQALTQIRAALGRGLPELLFVSNESPASSAPWAKLISFKDGRVAVLEDQLVSDEATVQAGGRLHEALPYLVAGAGLVAHADVQASWRLGLALRELWNRNAAVLEGAAFALNSVYLQTIDGAGGESGLWLVSDRKQITNVSAILFARFHCRGEPALVLTSNIDWIGQPAVSGKIHQLTAQASIKYLCGEERHQADARAILTFDDEVLVPDRSYFQLLDSH